MLAWWLTGSAALYSDALESIVNVVGSVVAFVALRFAAMPADANHPYGHDKAEFFSAVIEGVMIVIAAISIFAEAWNAWHTPHAFNSPIQGLALNAVATAINGFWAWVLIRAAKRLRSATLHADGRHLISDVVTACGVAVGFGLTVLTGYQKLDPADRGGDRALCALVRHLLDRWFGWRTDGHGARPRGVAPYQRTDLQATPPARSRPMTCAPARPAG